MSKKWIIPLGGVSLLSFIVHLFLLPSLPETVAVHWNAAGEVDGWGGKGMLLFLAALPLLLLLLFIAVPVIDPKRESYRKHMGVYQPFSALMVLFMIGVSWIVTLAGLGIELLVGTLINLALGLIFRLCQVFCVNWNKFLVQCFPLTA